MKIATKSTKRSLFIVLALVMMLALSAVPAFALSAPTATTNLPTPTEISSMTIGGAEPDFQQDNNGSAKFIRAELATEYDLKNATVEINLTSSDIPFSCQGLSFSADGATRTATGVNLFNHAYNVTIGSTTYIMAAGLSDGNAGISASDPLRIASVTINSEAATVYGFNEQNDFIGNPYYAGEDWTFVNYFVRDDLSSSLADRSAVPAVMVKDGSAGISGCAESTGGNNYDLNLSEAVPSFTVTNDGEERLYRVFVSTPDDVEVTFGFDLTEAEAYGGTVETTAEAIQEDIREYLGTSPVDGPDYATFSVPSGTTAMKLLEDFTNAMGYGDATTGSSYISSINGLGEFDGGSLSGWMYVDGPYTPTCSVPMVGAADYALTVDGTTIIWFYTTDYFNHF